MATKHVKPSHVSIHIHIYAHLIQLETCRKRCKIPNVNGLSQLSITNLTDSQSGFQFPSTRNRWGPNSIYKFSTWKSMRLFQDIFTNFFLCFSPFPDKVCAPMRCSSHYGLEAKCFAPPEFNGLSIIDLKVLKNHSHTECVLDENYTKGKNYITVKDGCKADFEVCFDRVSTVLLNFPRNDQNFNKDILLSIYMKYYHHTHTLILKCNIIRGNSFSELMRI